MLLRGALFATKQSPVNEETASQRALAATSMLEAERGRLEESVLARDDAVMNTRDDWAARIKRRRHIGDFSDWMDKTGYRKSFERLLRDLKATSG